MCVEHIARRQVFDDARRRIDAQLVAGFDFLDFIADFEQRQTDVDAVAVENAKP